jgi:hypothetical protein
MENISKSFTLDEFLYSEQAQRFPNIAQLQKKPPKNVVDSLVYLCNTTLQKISNTFKYPITISSGYRCKELNHLVGSSDTSQHVLGEAADISIPNSFLTDVKAKNIKNMVNTEVIAKIGKPLNKSCNANFYLFSYVALHLNELDIDQLIYEYGNDHQPAWIHVSASKNKNKRQILKISNTGTKILQLKDALFLGV